MFIAKNGNCYLGNLVVDTDIVDLMGTEVLHVHYCKLCFQYCDPLPYKVNLSKLKKIPKGLSSLCPGCSATVRLSLRLSQMRTVSYVFMLKECRITF